jgi:uncharacterized protein YcfJ
LLVHLVPVQLQRRALASQIEHGIAGGVFGSGFEDGCGQDVKTAEFCLAEGFVSERLKPAR